MMDPPWIDGPWWTEPEYMMNDHPTMCDCPECCYKRKHPQLQPRDHPDPLVERLRAILASADDHGIRIVGITIDEAKSIIAKLKQLAAAEAVVVAAAKHIAEVEDNPDLGKRGDLLCGCVGASDDCREPPICGWCQLRAAHDLARGGGKSTTPRGAGGEG